MEIKEMNFDELETRRAELAGEIAEADAEKLDAINAELDAIEARKKEIKAEAEERAKAIEEVINAPEPTPIIEERNNKTMTSKEIRNTQEYIDAYVEYCKRNYDLDRVGAEARALLTENAIGGTIAVPVYVENRINTAWENDEIMRRVRRTFFAGNVKVGVELGADPAVVHTEGTAAINEENLRIQYISLVPEYLKKMVRISHTAMALTGTAFLDYLYDEIEYQIVKKAGEEVLTIMNSSTLTETFECEGDTPTTADIIAAEGKLGGEASDIVFITSRTKAAALKAAALNANYAYDPFDGLPVIYVSDAFLATINAGGFVADLSGVQANFPEGGEPRFIFDEYTEAPANIVRIVGRLLMAVAVIATGKVVKLIVEGSE